MSTSPSALPPAPTPASTPASPSMSGAARSSLFRAFQRFSMRPPTAMGGMFAQRSGRRSLIGGGPQ